MSKLFFYLSSCIESILIQYKCQIICMWFTWIWNFSMGKKRTKTQNKQWKHKHKLSLKKLFKQSNCQSSTCLQSNWFYALNLILIKANTGNLTDVEVEMERISRSQTGYEYNLDKTTQRSRWRLDEGIKLRIRQYNVIIHCLENDE